MADDIWQAPSAGNWDTGANWSLGAKPAGTNDVWFVAGNSNPVVTGHTDEQAVTLNKLTFQPGNGSVVGSSGSRLTISTVQLWHRGNGKVWFAKGTAAVDYIVVDGAAGGDLLDYSGAIGTMLNVLRGQATFSGAAATCPRATIGTRGQGGSEAKVTLGSDLGTWTDVHLEAGYATASNVITNAYLNGGRLVKPIAAITNAWVGAGATLEYQATDTIAKLFLFPGSIVDFTIGRTTPCTITELFRYPGHRIIGQEGIHYIVTNDRPPLGEAA